MPRPPYRIHATRDDRGASHPEARSACGSITSKQTEVGGPLMVHRTAYTLAAAEALAARVNIPLCRRCFPSEETS